MISIELSVDYEDEGTARAVLEALGPDNIGYVESELRDNAIVFRCSSESAGSLRVTADDLMACLKTAEEIVGVATAKS